MALPLTGKISLNDVNNELNKTGQISLGSTDVRNLAEKLSGTITMDDLHGKEKIKIYTFDMMVGQGGHYHEDEFGYDVDYSKASISPTQIEYNGMIGTWDKFVITYSELSKYRNIDIIIKTDKKFVNPKYCYVKINDIEFPVDRFSEQPTSQFYYYKGMLYEDSDRYRTLDKICNYIADNYNKNIKIEMYMSDL